MKIIDMHVHAQGTEPQPELLLRRLDESGIYGCTVMSNNPHEMTHHQGSDFDRRLTEVLSWTKGYEDRLFPVLWIHPNEEGICEKVEAAAKSGVVAFKIICNNFYVGDTKCMDLLSRISELDKAVIFHSGILWDASPSSAYNRPVNWEALLDLKKLRFSLAHCSWPWIDECVAVYGKFLNARSVGKQVEMFVDLTPGTPVIYREELFKKLFFTGYDIPNNVMYGTDCSADDYHADWARKWLTTDTALFDKLGIPSKMRQKIFSDNFLRFIGRSHTDIKRFIPTPDSQTDWTPDLEK